MNNIHTIEIKIKYIIPIFFIIILILIYFNKDKENYTISEESDISKQNNIFKKVVSSYLDTSGNTSLDISGNKKFKTLKTTNLYAKNLRGIIVAWSGTIDTIPSGWILCDGQPHDGITPPDLRDRFIIGASKSSTTSLSSNLTPKYVNDISGTNTVTLKEDQIPFHNHDLDWSSAGCLGNNCGNSTSFKWVGAVYFTQGYLIQASYVSPMALPEYTSTYSSENNSHNNMPPFYHLAYIMKI